MMLSEEIAAQLREVEAYCDEHDKSTEFMLQMMCDTTDLTIDEVVEYLYENSEEYV